LIASLDTCFIIDWARYRNRRILEEIFEHGYVVEEILNEVKSESAVAYLGELMARDFLVIYPFRSALNDIVKNAVQLSMAEPQIRVIDPPEALALAIAVRENCVCVTENRGVLELVRIHPDRFNVGVWRSYEILKEANRMGVIENLSEELANYEKDTRHMFPRRENR